MKFTIGTDDKPNLEKAMKENPEQAKEVISVFVSLMEEAFSRDKGVTWAELPKQLHKDLDFGSLVRGVLRGSLDLKDISPESFDALKVEIHPLAMLQPRKNYLDGSMRYTNWRNHFSLPDDAQVNEKTVADIFRKLLRYGRFVKIDELRKALEANQIAVHRGLGDVQMEKLPFTPALRYQREHFGELHVGKFMDEVGFFDCGTIGKGFEGPVCPACGHDSLDRIEDYALCLDCNAGFIK